MRAGHSQAQVSTWWVTACGALLGPHGPCMLGWVPDHHILSINGKNPRKSNCRSSEEASLQTAVVGTVMSCDGTLLYKLIRQSFRGVKFKNGWQYESGRAAVWSLEILESQTPGQETGHVCRLPDPFHLAMTAPNKAPDPTWAEITLLNPQGGVMPLPVTDPVPTCSNPFMFCSFPGHSQKCPSRHRKILCCRSIPANRTL